MLIESKDNKKLKYIKKLQDKRFAILEGKTVVESPKIIKELIQLGFVEEVIVEENSQYLEDVKKCKNITFISCNLTKYLAQTEASTGVFAIAKIPKSKMKITKRALILDNIQDPNNYGAICRSAAAFGFDTIFDINCTFAYSSKVSRCSMGNNFKLNIIKSSYEDIKKTKKENDMHLFCCDMNGKDVKNARPTAKNFAIIIGNEGNGVANELRELADETIAIPMQNDVESLNAGVTASIIMYTFA